MAVAETLEEIKLIESKAAAAAEFARKNKIGFEEQNEWGKFRCEIEGKKGAWLDERFPKGVNKKFRRLEQSTSSMVDEGITKEESTAARLIHNEPDKMRVF